MRSGVRLGIDVGRARIGIARSDLHGMLATPIETVKRGEGDVARILSIASEIDAVEFVVGLPLSLSGASTPSTDDAREFAMVLARSGMPTRLVDERLSTVSAQQALRANGRTTKNSRSVVDQVAAVIILQHALDSERSSGNAPGSLVVPDEGTA
ncbi:Holliday junction resolvase RuvX [Salinibacterium hongtaonis]|uniref:Putative pre-16S rRNA nuclease n=1 Tax=Homoserinimonas hongtaonis TaxID=2079791 RepID=A0A2U1SYN5_9MICO|nr:Holliday junction resolvase RuvX [Salinibacterium hongtaonis]AWB89291.1 Holliday junction resolvase RuvX [Salinibacterium hongtaonis]PWB96740.1 Holliday junction resolvase RuvX [Salinibacterium hongtaonis]